MPPEPAAAPMATLRGRRRAGLVVVVAGLGGLLAAGAYTSAAVAAPVPAAVPEVADVAPPVGPPQAVDTPAVDAWALDAVGVQAPVTAGEASRPLPIASIAKVVTALVVLGEHPIAPGESGPEIAYTDADQAVYEDMVARGGSVAPVPVGGTLTLRESLEAMLLPSGNNYAVSLATWAFGSVDAYVQQANAWADAEGLSTLRVVDPAGMSRDNTSTATDLVRLGELALADPTVAGIVATPQATIPGVGTVTNTNQLLGVDGVDGIKTGTFTGAANLLFSADAAVGSTSVTLVGVVLGGDDQPLVREQVTDLLESVTPGLREVQVLRAGDELARYQTQWGDAATAVAAQDVSLVVWSDTPVDVAVEADPVAAAADGAQVGTAVVTAGEQQVSVPLVLQGDLDDPGGWWRLTHPGQLAWSEQAQAPTA